MREPLEVAGYRLHNRLVIQPMEGCDGTLDGSPGELTRRRYRRFAESGAGLIWMEAVAVVREGRANPRQLMLTRTNLDAFKRLTEDIREWAVRATGREPVLVMQATHSGRYSKPEGDPAPRIACRNPLFEKDMPLPDSCILSDDELRALPERYACSARLAEEAASTGWISRPVIATCSTSCCPPIPAPGPTAAVSRTGPVCCAMPSGPLRRPRRAGPLSPAASMCMTAFPILTGGGCCRTAASSRAGGAEAPGRAPGAGRGGAAAEHHHRQSLCQSPRQPPL